MGDPTLYERFQDLIACIGWRMFLWGSRMTEDQYLDATYRQEASRREGAV